MLADGAVIVVGFPAGGGFDTYSRIMAGHIGKYIPGNSTVIVDNVTGAEKEKKEGQRTILILQ